MSYTHTSNCYDAIGLLHKISSARDKHNRYVTDDEVRYVLGIVPPCKVCYDRIHAQPMISGRIWQPVLEIAWSELQTDRQMRQGKVMDVFESEGSHAD